MDEMNFVYKNLWIETLSDHELCADMLSDYFDIRQREIYCAFARKWKKECTRTSGTFADFFGYITTTFYEAYAVN